MYIHIHSLNNSFLSKQFTKFFFNHPLFENLVPIDI